MISIVFINTLNSLNEKLYLLFIKQNNNYEKYYVLTKTLTWHLLV